MKCSSCNREVNQNDTFCVGCGTKLTVSPIANPNLCSSCKNEMAPNQMHCQKCGSARDLFRTGEPAPIPASPSRSSKLQGIITISIGLAIILFAFWNFNTTGESLRLDNDPGVGLQHVVSVPIGIVGFIILIAGLVSLSKSSERS